MNTPDVPLRTEYTVQVPGTPEQVWDAIATANGISSWMMPTELEEREGGAVTFHMGPEQSSAGRVTRWEPPLRLVYEEPEWAALADQDPSTVTPLVTEFLVEATSGGTCVVRVVSSAFGTGADWEQEFLADMDKGWAPMFEHLRLYLTHFPGQRVTYLELGTTMAGGPTEAVSGIRDALGIESVGQTVDARGAKAYVERVHDESLLLRLLDPVPGLLAVYAWPSAEGTSMARVTGYLFSEDAQAYADREGPEWQAWLDSLGSSTSA